ncbi:MULTISPECIES: UbiA family prenyltransferase [unclassified Arcicella]|uniref:UbiA family prenyltransferase n=1 Tax=unclassified Arcicella TaxID=2644986 RepID=UPI0028667135|nr:MULTISPECIES: UbiA family prenyltransferase [unclassified Arcicella]MDR6563698.1 1,4-dihydroxy-2-naphthoate octaprenyltransferase [Arcicella sp. BE51]MDR6814780.1 1,4-dihydroxy-2-naphthoate octaprenyltransferase [Arcicella sp. BE140]MDR6826216.1 1,4-dihydroxy-2-naphthoate octaprenyltransferase [Arcicella sp. BE139]
MKNIILHLRIPFSFFLMPVYWFALSQTSNTNLGISIGVFFLLHLLIYPASNAYNSYYDKDEGSIGGLENPPPVSKALFYVAWGLDIIAVIIAYLLSGWILALALLIYSSISKAYSNDKIRLKKYPILSWITVGIFQGAFTYLTVIQAIDELPLENLLQEKYLFPALLSSFNLLGFYPMTQIYQHEEDAKRGDLTMSRLLGIRGTFIFTAGIFLLVTIGFFYFFQTQQIFQFPAFIVYLVVMSPVLIFFNSWFLKVLKDERLADYKHTMQLNFLGSICLNLFFILLYLSSH